MRNARSSLRSNLLVLAAASVGAWACGEANDGGVPMNYGGAATGTAGSSSSAGTAVAMAGTTNTGTSGSTTVGSGGASGSGTTLPQGGSGFGGPAGSAGQSMMGGSSGMEMGGGRPGGGAGGGFPGGGRGGMGMGGGPAGGASAGGSAPTAGSSSGGASSCTKGTKGNEVAVIGESFIAATHGITQEIEKQAKAAGSLGQSEHYIDNSVSGTTLANNQIPSQYTKAIGMGTIKYVLMDGGGNDCLINNNGDAALTAATSLFQTMAQNKTEKILYFFYPDPIGSNFSSLKTCLDALRPKMKALCDGLTAPKCYWLDLRPTWMGHNDYTSDGIHPTSAGSVATGDVIWDAMKTYCVAQ